jgi:hypothetical protein
MQLIHLKRKSSISRVTALLTVVGMVGLALVGCSGSSQKNTETQTNQATQKDAQIVHYTCSMHPEVLQDKPGDCPKCGMKLVEKR